VKTTFSNGSMLFSGFSVDFFSEGGAVSLGELRKIFFRNLYKGSSKIVVRFVGILLTVCDLRASCREII
jgi:hypothetical protein